MLTTGQGRILADEGYRIAPFKAQSMSLNSAATLGGCEIGRVQALQTEACRVPACTTIEGRRSALRAWSGPAAWMLPERPLRIGPIALPRMKSMS